MDRWPDARKALNKAHQILKEVGDQRFTRLVGLRLGAVEADAGDVHAARAAFMAADAAGSTDHDPVGSATAEVHRAHLLMAESNVEVRRQTASRIRVHVMGTEEAPGVGQRSADVRLALRMLERRVERKG